MEAAWACGVTVRASALAGRRRVAACTAARIARGADEHVIQLHHHGFSLSYGTDLKSKNTSFGSEKRLVVAGLNFALEAQAQMPENVIVPTTGSRLVFSA